MKKTFLPLIFGALLAGCSSNQNNQPPAPVPGPDLNPPSSTQTEDSKPIDKSGGVYANDLGPKDVEVSNYSATAQKGYKLLTQRCNQCHTYARPLNAQYIEVTAEMLAALQKSRPDLFKNKYLLQIDTEVWKRKIKQMMGKSGANISSDDARAIYAFLLEYYPDKVGKNVEHPDEWIAHRKQLLDEFKKKYPDRYKLLYGG